MSRWRRKRSDAVADDGSGFGDNRVFSDIKLVKRTDDESRDVLAELSAAFDDDVEGADVEGADVEGDDGDDDVTPPSQKLTTIAIGGDDELPDAVYLDDEIELADNESDTVFIDDDGTGDAVMPKEATGGPGIEPRLRQRRIGVRRAESRRRLIWAGVAIIVATVVIALLALLGSSWFAVQSVEVTGLDSADRAAVNAVITDLVDTPVLLVDNDEAESRLEAIAWVESARVRTDFPDAATIELRERVPVATAQGVDGRYRILDEQGRVLDVIEGRPIAFVLVAGPPVSDLEPGQFVGRGHAAAAAMVTKLTPAVRSRLVSMSTTDDGSDLRFLLSNEPGPDIEVRLGAAIGDNDQVERLVRLQLLLDDVIGSDTTVIDVSTGEATAR